MQKRGRRKIHFSWHFIPWLLEEPRDQTWTRPGAVSRNNLFFLRDFKFSLRWFLLSLLWHWCSCLNWFLVLLIDFFLNVLYWSQCYQYVCLLSKNVNWTQLFFNFLPLFVLLALLVGSLRCRSQEMLTSLAKMSMRLCYGLLTQTTVLCTTALNVILFLFYLSTLDKKREKIIENVVWKCVLLCNI